MTHLCRSSWAACRSAKALPTCQQLVSATFSTPPQKKQVCCARDTLAAAAAAAKEEEGEEGEEEEEEEEREGGKGGVEVRWCDYPLASFACYLAFACSPGLLPSSFACYLALLSSQLHSAAAIIAPSWFVIAYFGTDALLSHASFYSSRPALVPLFPPLRSIFFLFSSRRASILYP